MGTRRAEIDGANTANPTVRFEPGAFGEYVFELTVTDDQGLKGVAFTTVNYLDPVVSP